MSASQPDRLRTPPRERFTGDTRVFDLEEIFEHLAAEEHPAIEGHHQITLFKSGTSTVMAFLFHEQGRFRRHRAEGVVIIEVVQGCVEVEMPEEKHAVDAGRLMVIRPGVPHEVVATRESKMIMTVHLHPDESSGG